MSVLCGCMDGPNDPDPKCHLCLGTGEPDAAWLLSIARKHLCPECQGRGYVDNPDAQWGTAEDGAEYCNGPEDMDCPECRGVGFVAPRKTVPVSIYATDRDDGMPF